jgi:ATP-dependent Lon protease
LLEVLDPEQNKAFSDHYLELPFDLSDVFFITTANTLDPIPKPLRDRMEIIEMSGYTEEEKMGIVKGYLIPKELKNHGLKVEQVAFDDTSLLSIIREYTKEAGVRSLERTIATILRKIVTTIIKKKKEGKITVKSENLHEYLGAPKYRFGIAEEKDQVGAATGLAWTEVGGDTVPIEVTIMKGRGSLTITGQLGEVMQESAKAAMSCIRSRADVLGIDEDFYRKTDIHIHVPEGAVPKDGPSAGITIATALASALTQIPIRHDVAMTGEITLLGKVLPIGGLKEKLLAAKRAGMTDVILPEENRKDLDEIKEEIPDGIKFHLVKEIDEVLDIALVRKPGAKKKEEAPRKNPPPVEGQMLA